MAGEGSRLKDTYSEPKPFVKIDELTLLELSLIGIPREWKVVLVIREEYSDRLDALMESSPVFEGRDCVVSIFPGQSSGQAETALFGMLRVPMDAPIVVSNCDTYFSNDFVIKEGYDGLLGTFSSSDPKYSYVEIVNGVATRTAEKEVISDRASSGLYYFSDVETYIDAYISTDWDGERYIAPMYNSMINKGKKVGEVQQELVVPLGTPEEIQLSSKFRLWELSRNSNGEESSHTASKS